MEDLPLKNLPVKKERKKIKKNSIREQGELIEINEGPSVSLGATANIHDKQPIKTTMTTVSIEMGRKQSSDKEKEKEKEKKPKRTPLKERWLLTRKTWKYMTDAGRSLIPAGTHNRQEDLPKIEEYFQQICKSEPKFILWKRKSSYPGARGTSRHLRRPDKGSKLRNFRSVDESIDEAKIQSQNADIVLNILRDYLGISDNSRRTATLLGTTTSRPDDTDSPSSQRPIKPQSNIPKSYSHLPSTSTSFGSPSTSQLREQQQRAYDTQAQISELLERLRSYSQSVSRPIIPPDRITTDILEDKVLLKRIYTELKKQQLHRILGKHPTRSPLHLPHSSSLSNLWHFRRDTTKDLITHYSPTNEAGASGAHNTGSGGNTLHHHSTGIPLIFVKKPSCEKSLSTHGTQTDFIQLQELQRMAKEYDEKKKEEENQRATTDEEAEKGSQRSRRKSSIDNEDVSQSVSDTIKRYLRMARKKSVHDDHANRFKRVNYDRNLRNIHAKGEINPPGMDEDNSKATQTLDSWPLLLLNYIRGVDNPKLLEDSHSDWQASLQRRIKQKEDYDKQQKKNEKEEQHEKGQGSSASPSHSSSIFHSAKHRQQHQQNDTTMQKSKSSSNVGQFVSKKIWRSRSRSQTRNASPIKSEWTPQGNCVWTTSSGKQLVLSDVKLQDLTEIERRILHRVAVEKINQLNLGITVTAPSEVSSSNTDSIPKKRRPLLIKRKALTTSFFDTGKKTEDKGGGGGGGLVFGVSLEKCVNNDNRSQNKSTSSTVGLDRGSRNSIASLLGSSSKGSENIGSCESLPSHSNVTGSTVLAGGRLPDDGNTFVYPTTASEQMSRSQMDVHRLSQDEDDLLASAPPMVSSARNTSQQVPTLVTACINHLEEHGMHTVGIFRVSTSKKRVRQLKEDFDRGEISALDSDICPHDVATILKEYLRDLPEPLLCRNLYKAFVKTQKIRNRRLQLEALSHLIQLLPVAHRDTLFVLMKFLAKVVRSSDDITSRDGTILSVGNKMDSSNLATVFAPNILRYSSPGRNTTEQEIDEQLDVINVIRTMIDHYEELFRVPAELIDEIYTNMMDSHPQQLNYLCEKRDLHERYDDSANSTSTSTPLSSPPPVTSPTAVPSSGVFEQSQRRIYSREDFLHENAAKCEPNGNLSRRRERSSKTKHQENENDQVTRKHHYDHHRSGASDTEQSPVGGLHQQLTLHSKINENSNRNTINQAASQQKKDVQHSSGGAFNSLSRRLSSPHILQNTGVLTASLKIPVQVQNSNGDQQLHQQHNSYTNHGYPGQLDLQDIPFIEDDGGASASYNRNEPIKGSIFLGGIPESKQSSAGVYNVRMSSVTDPSKDEKVTGPSISPYQRNSSSPHISATQFQTSKRNDNSKTASSSSHRKHSTVGSGVSSEAQNQQQQQQFHSEPKITPSIMSIGGAVLRSKTADFERMSTQQRRQQPRDFEDFAAYGSSSGGAAGSSINTQLSSSSVPATENEPERTRRTSQGPIYKRQELISSAVKPKPNK